MQILQVSVVHKWVWTSNVWSDLVYLFFDQIKLEFWPFLTFHINKLLVWLFIFH